MGGSLFECPGIAIGPVYDGTRVVMVRMAHTLSSPLPRDEGLPLPVGSACGGELSSWERCWGDMVKASSRLGPAGSSGFSSARGVPGGFSPGVPTAGLRLVSSKLAAPATSNLAPPSTFSMGVSSSVPLAGLFFTGDAAGLSAGLSTGLSGSCSSGCCVAGGGVADPSSPTVARGDEAAQVLAALALAAAALAGASCPRRMRVYPVSFLKLSTAVRRKRLGMRLFGDMSVSWQTGHSCCSESRSSWRTHSSQKLLPQQGMSTASCNRSWQIMQSSSSGSCGSCTGSGVASRTKGGFSFLTSL